MGLGRSNTKHSWNFFSKPGPCTRTVSRGVPHGGPPRTSACCGAGGRRSCSAARMEIDRLGEGLLEACGTAQEELVLCAPFIKKHVLQRLVDATAPSVGLEVFTRWRPDEVAAGVSDTAILSIAAA